MKQEVWTIVLIEVKRPLILNLLIQCVRLKTERDLINSSSLTCRRVVVSEFSSRDIDPLG